MIVDTQLQLGCLYEPPLAEEQAGYVRYLSRLLDSPPQLLPEPGDGGGRSAEQGALSRKDLDLLLYFEPETPRWQYWLGWTPAIHVLEHTHTSVLFARQPRWPLRRILLILRADETDNAAILWLGHLAASQRAHVFVLPVIPPVPAMYRHGTIPLDADVLLSPHTFCGAQLHRLVDLCAAWGIEGTLLLRDTPPQRRIAWAAQASHCDLLILSHEPFHWLQRRLLGELVRPLLCRADRPVLVARAATHGTQPVQLN